MWKNNSFPYSYQKRDVYYFSRRVPKDLEDYYRSSKITISRTLPPMLPIKFQIMYASIKLMLVFENGGNNDP